MKPDFSEYEIKGNYRSGSVIRDRWEHGYHGEQSQLIKDKKQLFHWRHQEKNLTIEKDAQKHIWVFPFLLDKTSTSTTLLIYDTAYMTQIAPTLIYMHCNT